MSWPDPHCQKNHQPGATYSQWEHTPDCVRHAPRKIKKDRRVPERSEGDTELLQRARQVGAI